MTKTHLILGSSAASIGVLGKLRKLCPDDTIICLTAQAEMPYNTCLLADYLSEGTPPKTLWTKTAAFFEEHNITLHRNHRVTAIDAANKMVTCDNGASFAYDTLFIGTGTTQRQLPTAAPVRAGLFGFQTLTDTTAMDSRLRGNDISGGGYDKNENLSENGENDNNASKSGNGPSVKTALVIGAGLSGVECADALTERGVQVTLLEYGSHLLPTLVNQPAAEAVMHHVHKAGTTFRPDTSVKEITVDDAGHATGALLADGTILNADMVVVAIGATPNSDLAAAAGLTVAHGGIVVDEHMRTSDQSIFAGGDVACVPQRNTAPPVRSCTWPDAMQQGMYAARAMAGAPAAYPGVTIVLSSHFFETQFVSCGPVTNPPAHYTRIERSGDGWYQLYLVDDGILKGFLLVDKLEQVGDLRRMVTMQLPFE